FGRHKLYAKVSPNKTWEGAIAGVISATLMAFGIRAVLSIDIETSELLVLAPIGAVLGQVGDLSESLLKRSVGVKDSGSIMPGHGGLFDRIDALIFTGPTVFIYAAGWRALSPEYLPGF
ncbi:MAG: phosphatidate cytidylyltransferase, partial [Myxococcota bacterium]